MLEGTEIDAGFSFARCAVLGTALFLSGCIVSRVDPEIPQQTLPESFAVDSASAMPQLLDPWWTVLGDPALDALIDEALANNPDVAIAAARVQQARAVAVQDGADRWPGLNLEGDGSRGRYNLGTTLGDANAGEASAILESYRAQGAVSYELDLWGRYLRQSQAARSRWLASEYDREALKLSLTGEVARAYYNLIASTEQLVRSRETLASREEALAIERIREEAGESDELTVRRVEGEAATTRITTAQLELETLRNAHALSLLLGRAPKEIAERTALVGGASTLPAAPVIPADLPSALLERRPDIRSAEASLLAAASDVGVARAAMFPSIRLTGAYGSESLELGDLFTAPTEIWSVAAGITQPLFQGGRLRAGVDRAEGAKQEARAQYAKTVQTAFREVLDALRGQRLLSVAEQANAAQVAALSRATELAELRYEEGDLAYLDLLDARRSLYVAQISHIAARRDVLLNTIDLALGVGGGIGPRAEQVTAR